MHGLISVNGYYTSEAETYRNERLKEEFKKLGVKADIAANNRPVPTGGGFDADFVVFFDKDVHLAAMMEAAGVPVFNSSVALENTDDKVKTAIILSSHGVSVPATIPGPKRYYGGTDPEFLKTVGEKLSYPLVLKPCRGSLGRGVCLVNSLEELIAADSALEEDKLYQKFVGRKGVSIRAVVVGGKFLCAVKLSNDKDFRSNAALGGRPEKIILDGEYRETAEKTAEILGLDYCGVDFCADSPAVLEVNGNAYFGTTEKTTGVNVAGKYAEYIVNAVGRIKNGPKRTGEKHG